MKKLYKLLQLELNNIELWLKYKNNVINFKYHNKKYKILFIITLFKMDGQYCDFILLLSNIYCTVFKSEINNVSS